MTPAALLVVSRALSLVALLARQVALARRGGRQPRHSQSAFAAELLRRADGAVVRAAGAHRASALWLAFQDSIILRLVTAHLPADIRELPPIELALVLNDVRNVVAGNVPPRPRVREAVRAAASEYLQLRGISRIALTVLVIVIGIIGMMIVRREDRAGVARAQSPWSASSNGC